MKKLACIIGFLMCILPLTTSYGAEKAKVLSPYFFVQSEDPSVDPFPLLETKAKVDIAGVIAEIELTQVYKNEGKRTIEAIYCFPLGTKSAIHAMRMRIGDRIIEAKIEERLTAKRIYDQAKQEGKVASLLEQERPNVFQMKVANIMPGDRIEVKVSYTELLVPEKGIYEFVFPTVVGPRYSNKQEGDAKDNDTWLKTPYLHEGEEPPYACDITANLRTGIPLSNVWVSSHKVAVQKEGDRATIKLAPEEKKGGNKDFILRYTLQGEQIQSGLLLYPGAEENFFLLMLQPPKKVTVGAVPPREYVFIVDVSGSMHGFPLEVSKSLITEIIQNLRKKDYFNILFFASGSQVLSPHPLQATKENVRKAIAMLEGQQGSGGTEILPALKRALALEKKEGLSRIIVTATDGYVAVEKEAFELIRENLNKANFFAFGIGSSVNRYLIEGMARAGKGEPFVVTNQGEATEATKRFAKFIDAPLLTDIEISFQGFDAYDIEPPALPDLFAQRPLILFGKYRDASGKIRIRGKTVWGGYKKTFAVHTQLEDEGNTALQYLWAREKIARLDDYGKIGADVKEEVTKLGLRYHLMTQYTSFVAVDTIVRDTGEVVTVKQPLPLPEGVTDYAVGDKGRTLQTAPMAYLGKGLVMHEATADCCASGEKSELPLHQIYIMGGKLPAGMTMGEVEQALSTVKGDLEQLFQQWSLTKAIVLLTVEQGKVTAVQVKSYQGKGYKKEALEKVLQKIAFASSVKGTIEVELQYM
ncbi:MAG: VWA domain-containing protein [Deltaproteobacteria bacterium]|nr:VWA domain-containing protein [Deltaproteobacteria bacterium]